MVASCGCLGKVGVETSRIGMSDLKAHRLLIPMGHNIFHGLSETSQYAIAALFLCFIYRWLVLQIETSSTIICTWVFLKSCLKFVCGMFNNPWELTWRWTEVFVFSPNGILCGWLGSKHQLTNSFFFFFTLMSTVPAEGFRKSVWVGHGSGTVVPGCLPGALQSQEVEKVSPQNFVSVCLLLFAKWCVFSLCLCVIIYQMVCI